MLRAAELEKLVSCAELKLTNLEVDRNTDWETGKGGRYISVFRATLLQVILKVPCQARVRR